MEKRSVIGLRCGLQVKPRSFRALIGTSFQQCQQYISSLITRTACACAGIHPPLPPPAGSLNCINFSVQMCRH